MKTEIRNKEAKTYACIRHVGPYPEIGQAFEKISAWAKENNIPFKGSVGIWYDNPQDVPQDQLRSDAGVEVDPYFTTDHPDIHLVTIPAGKYGVGIHEGSYNGLGEAWNDFLCNGLPSLGEPNHEWYFERYANTCDEVSEEELITELHASLN